MLIKKLLLFLFFLNFHGIGMAYAMDEYSALDNPNLKHVFYKRSGRSEERLERNQPLEIKELYNAHLELLNEKFRGSAVCVGIASRDDENEEDNIVSGTITKVLDYNEQGAPSFYTLKVLLPGMKKKKPRKITVPAEFVTFLRAIQMRNDEGC